jgi:hypothetical protein
MRRGAVRQRSPDRERLDCGVVIWVESRDPQLEGLRIDAAMRNRYRLRVREAVRRPEAMLPVAFAPVVGMTTRRPGTRFQRPATRGHF